MSKTKYFPRDFKEVIISLASPESILARSYGEIITPETKNHRTYKAEPGGFFCPRIFGPEKDWECACGKYKGIKYKATVCDRCGVEINEKKVRRERMGHIKLATPLVHPWFFQYQPNILAYLLNIPSKKLENIIYYASYIVLQPGAKAKEGIQKMDLLTLKEYDKHLTSLPKNQLLSDNDPNKFVAKTGGEVIQSLLKALDLDQLSKDLREQIDNETSMQRKEVAVKRLRIVEAFRHANKNGVLNKPEWMVVNYLPVMSPNYRPLVLLHNGRFATSDTTELLKTLLIRNNRLKQLLDMRAPDIIVLNEKRMLQGSLNKLFDYSGKSSITTKSRVLKSLGESLKGKRGQMRSGGLLGKRVDFSGRSVITTNPKLKLNECGIPKTMAIVLYEPYIIQVLKRRGLIRTYKEGKKMVEANPDVVWSILEKVIKEHPVLLNRAPTLHRHGIQAFYPKLVEGKSIHLHPLVCQGFNADHDGDLMGLHLPLSQEAITEASMLMMPSQNMLNASNGSPIIVPSKDIVLGLYYLTKGKKSTPKEPTKGEGAHFASIQEAILAFNNQQVSHKAHVKLRIETPDGLQNIETVVGRILFNQCLPKEMGFVNEVINSNNIYQIVFQTYQKLGGKKTAEFLDAIKKLGFEWISRGGLTFGLDDMKTPAAKDQIIQKAAEEVEEVKNNYYEGLITNIERYNQIIDIWTKASIDITNELFQTLQKDKEGFNTLFMMNDSGARGSKDQLKQLCGMRGLMSTPKKHSNAPGSIIEQPIISSLKDGLSPLEYFTATRGSRKGLSDTTLKTADAGFFTRKLIYTAQNAVILEHDCNTLNGRLVEIIHENGQVKVPLSTQVISRVIAEDVIDPIGGNLIFKRGDLITDEIAQKIDELSLPTLKVRSPIYCEAKRGICIACYGLNLGNNRMAEIGDVVGNIAAQSISEPGTQLTLRTFHTGGAFSGNVVEDTIRTLQAGTIQISNLKIVFLDNKKIVISKNCEVKLISEKTKQAHQSHLVPYGATLMVKDRQVVDKGATIFEWNPYKIPILAHTDGNVHFESIEESVTYKEQHNELTGHTERIIIDSTDKEKIPAIIIEDGQGNQSSYTIPIKAQLNVEDGQKIKAGQILAQIPRPKSSPQDIVGGACVQSTGYRLHTKIFQRHQLSRISRAVV